MHDLVVDADDADDGNSTEPLCLGLEAIALAEYRVWLKESFSRRIVLDGAEILRLNEKRKEEKSIDSETPVKKTERRKYINAMKMAMFTFVTNLRRCAPLFNGLA